MAEFFIVKLSPGSTGIEILQFLNKHQEDYQVSFNIEKLERFMHFLNGSVEIHLNKRPLYESKDRLSSEEAGHVKRLTAGRDCEFQVQSIGMNPFKIQGTSSLQQTEVVRGRGSNSYFNSSLLEQEPPALNAAELLMEKPEENSLFSEKLVKEEIDEDCGQKIEAVEDLMKQNELTEDVGDSENLEEDGGAKNSEAHYGVPDLQSSWKTAPVNGYACNFCVLEFSTFRLLQRHHKSNHPLCDECGIRFCTQEEIFIHRLVHVTCDICGKVLSAKDALKEHRMIHMREKKSEGEEKKEIFKCDVCGKTFGRKNYWRNHMRKHPGQKPYKCDQCQESFASSVNLYTHRCVDSFIE